jgi:hypothetical protein
MKHVVLTLALFPALAIAVQITMTNPQEEPDGERENAMHVSEQHLLVYSGDALTVLPVLQDV